MKNKINNKGFTLIEILAVVVIIGILVAIAIPAISKYVTKGKEKYYTSLENEMVIIARDYYTKNKSELPRGQYDANGVPMYINQVPLSTLIEKGYVTNDIVDADKNPCTGYVRVENKTKGKYEYVACIKCGDKYTSEANNAYCTLYENFDELKNANGALLCNIDTGNNNTWTNKDINATVTSIYENGTPAQIGMYKNINSGAIIKAVNNSATIKVTESGSLKVYTYDKLGNRGECTLDNIKIDKESPSVSFTSSNITKDNNGVKITATLKDNNGIVAYQVNQSSNTPSEGWSNINEMKETTITTDYLTTTDSTTYYIWAKDVAGNTSRKRIIVGLSGWSSWNTTSCNVGTLCERKATYRTRSCSDICSSQRMVVTNDNVGRSSALGSWFKGDPNCPSGTTCSTYYYNGSESSGCGTTKSAAAYYTYGSWEASSLGSRYKTYDLYYYGCYYECTGYTTQCSDWSSYTDTACSVNNTTCQSRYEYKTRSYTYTID